MVAREIGTEAILSRYIDERMDAVTKLCRAGNRIP
jgi:hypothetical protein